MRILRVLTRLNLGGPARQVLASDSILKQRGHELRILAGAPEPGEGDLFGQLLERGLDVQRVAGLGRGINPLRDLQAGRGILRAIEEFQPEVLHTHASKAGYLGRRALGKLARSEGIARVHTFHGHVLEGYFPAAISKRLIAKERQLAALTDRILAVSHATGDDLVRLGVVDEERLVVVPPGVELDAFLDIERYGESAAVGAEVRSLIGAGPGDVLIGCIGRLAEVKRVDWAVDVFESLAARFPKAHLVFVGDGDQRRSLEKRIASLGALAERVHLLGAVDHMQPVYEALDTVLLTSRSEGLPVALIEAAAAGLPVVATSVGGVGELVAHERTGWLGATREELGFGLAKVLEDTSERLAMGGRARLRVVRQHSAERLAGRLEDVYGAVMAMRATTRNGGEA
jgi:glycosyltransferase involved in cell wall biosynthesis